MATNAGRRDGNYSRQTLKEKEISFSFFFQHVVNSVVEAFLFNFGMKSLLTKEEKDFMERYHARLSSMQIDVEVDEVLYTKITLSYAVLTSLTFFSLLFHPLSVDTRKITESYLMTHTNTLELFETIICYELDTKKPCLTKNELDKVIEHFRYLQSISSYDFSMRVKGL